MAEFKKFSEAEKIESMSDTASVLVEDKGEIKRIPAEKVGGGAGLPEGAMPYQQLVTDDKGNAKWEEKPFYTERVKNAKIVDNAKVNISNGMANMNDPTSFVPIDGESYVVTIDNVEYNAVAKKIDGMGVIFGNEALLYGTPYDGTGLPFAYGYAYQNSSGTFMMAEDGTHTVSIVGAVDVIHKLDSKYRSATVFYLNKDNSLFYKNPNLTGAITQDEVKEAFYGGGIILYNVVNGITANPLYVIWSIETEKCTVFYYEHEASEMRYVHNYIGQDAGVS